MMADLVGFTSLSEVNDPETVKSLVDECFERLVEVITQHGGIVDKIIGDAIVALFGAPVAHEDDPERAVRAGLAMQNNLASTAERFDSDIRMRVGINTGEVVVGALRAGGDYTAMGDVVNTADRLQKAAPPGGVVVGAATHAATEEVIDYASLGSLDAKGKEEPVEAWRAEGTLVPPGHRRRRYTPLVGRDDELGMLQHAVNASVERRRSHLIVLVGEAGVGKTRLAEELAATATATHGALVLEGRCVPYGEANVWWPFADALRQALLLDGDESPDEAAEALQDVVGSYLDDLAEVERVTHGMLHLLGLDGRLREIDPQRAREEVNRSILTMARVLASDQPLVLILSDLHWADDVVLEMVHDLSVQLSRHPLIVVGTAREELYERWAFGPGRHNHIVVNLDPLDRDASAVLLDLLSDTDLPREVRDALLDRSDGNPFFLEELLALVGSGRTAEAEPGTSQAGRSSADLPDTLRGLVAARLDALSPTERGLLEDAAVWGRGGRIDVLDTMASHEGRPPVDQALPGLVAADVLIVDDDHWHFRSDLVRDVAYSTITKSDRARSHHGIAAYLESHVGEASAADDRAVDVVAHHYAQAALLARELGGIRGVDDRAADRAVVWVREAADRAHRAQVLPLSIKMFSQALELADERDAARAELLLGRARAFSEGRQHDEASADLGLAERIAAEHDLGATAARVAVVRGEIAQHRGQLDESAAILETAVADLAALGDRRGEAEALRALGLTLVFAGRHRAAEEVIELALEISRELDDGRGEAWASQQIAWIAFVEGRTTEANERLDRAAATFRELGDRGGLGWVEGLRAFVLLQQGRLDEARELSDELLPEARARGDRWAEGMMLVLGASVRLWAGRASGALPLVEEALSAFRAIDDSYGEFQAMFVRGRTLVALGRITDGFRSLEAAARLGQLTGEDAEQTMLVGAAAQVGDPHRVAGRDLSVPESDIGSLGVLETAVGSGLLLLQTGRVPEALETLEIVVAAGDPVVGETRDASGFALGALALARASAGDEAGASEAAERALASTRATYLDHLNAELATALTAARTGADDARSRLDGLRELVDGTDDQVAHAVARLGRGLGLVHLGDDSGPAALADADLALADLGLGAEGWRRVFGGVLDPVRV